MHPLPAPLSQGRGDFTPKLIFNPTTLEVDAALWGSFWQGDVISAGYTLPAPELAFLRESQLARTTASPSPADYLVQLQNSLTRKPIGVWETTITHHVLRCVAVPEISQWRIIWHTETTIFAGYGSPPIAVPGYNLRAVQSPAMGETAPVPEPLQSHAQQILESLPQWADNWQTLTPTARIDHAIQAHRAYSILPKAQTDIAAWLDVFGG